MSPSDRWHVASAHLESLDSKAVRAEQLAAAADIFRQADGNVLFLGDFNFCSERNWIEGKRLKREGEPTPKPYTLHPKSTP